VRYVSVEERIGGKGGGQSEGIVRAIQNNLQRGRGGRSSKKKAVSNSKGEPQTENCRNVLGKTGVHLVGKKSEKRRINDTLRTPED